jgi:hypothetical protein
MYVAVCDQSAPPAQAIAAVRIAGIQYSCSLCRCQRCTGQFTPEAGSLLPLRYSPVSWLDQTTAETAFSNGFPIATLWQVEVSRS